MNSAMFKEVILDGHSLDLKQVVAVARGYADETGERAYPVVRLSKEARDKLIEVRAFIDDNWMNDDSPPIYGFNTGVGPLKNHRISAVENERFQLNLLQSHAACIGDPAPEEEVRATMLIRANALARGVSGVRVEVVERLIKMLNKNVLPLIPEQGSVGASGDLGPLSHLVISLVGHEEAEAFYRGKRIKASEALRAAGITPVNFVMKAKDVLAMINGCSFSLAYGALVLEDGWKVLKNANLAAAISIEAFRGEMAAFDHRIQEARNQAGQIKAAAEIRKLLSQSEWVTEKGRKVLLAKEEGQGQWDRRVQDAYTLRCIPQVHGAVYDVLCFAQDILEREMNAATDNPLIFETADKSGYEGLSGGNFHGQYLAFATDFLAIAVSELGDLSERRSARMLDANINFGIPQNLVGGETGINTGFTVTQCAASALVMENRTLCSPTSADSIPNKSNQEDHVSNATWSARKARSIIENSFKIIGIEYLCACQGISTIQPHMKDLRLGKATKKVYEYYRSNVPVVIEDRFMHPLMEKSIELTIKGDLLKQAGEDAEG